MTRFASLATAAALAVLSAAPLAAQKKAATPVHRDTTAAAARVSTEAAADSAVRELSRAMTVLAASVQDIVAQTANKPEVRLAAVHVAEHAVTLAQRTLAENALEMEKLLNDASHKIAEADASQRHKMARDEAAEKAKAAKP